MNNMQNLYLQLLANKISNMSIDFDDINKLKELISSDSEYYKNTILMDIVTFGISPLELPIILDEFLTRITAKYGRTKHIEEPFIPWLHLIKDNITWNYWNTYKESLLNNGGFSGEAIKSLDESTFEILSLLFNPKDITTTKTNRRGLVVGNVQSGKTANYIGLVAKSLDVGFKTVFIITGVHEVLRTQTYNRIVSELGTAGIRYYTSEDDDFRGLQSKLKTDLDSSEDKHIFIVKKNTKVLRNINDFLSNNHIDKIASPMMFIDDEADNASINTKDIEDPTRTNAGIREILARFMQKAYVGYTATPYANVFIQKEITHSSYEDDLFPKDFIVALPINTQYCGLDTYRGTESTTLYKILEKENELDQLFLSIEMFLLSTAIRYARKDIDHNSMLIHISSRILAHKETVDVVKEYIDKLKNELYNPNKSLFLRLKQLFHNEYQQKSKLLKPDLCDKWEIIEKEISKVLLLIEVIMVNSEGDNLVYNEIPKTYIIIGGSKLSRGLTLEGLTISFFDRNSKQFDTLMQMGRWFGYKKKFIDVCRVIADEAVIKNFDNIGESDQYLRDEIELIRNKNITPKDYAVKVLGHYNLLPTSRNKMKTVYKFGGLSGKTRETLKFNEFSNISIINKYLEDISITKLPLTFKDNLLWLDVEFESIRKFMKIYNFHPEESNMNLDVILKYIEQFHKDSKFNVALRLPENAQGRKEEIFGKTLNFANRQCKSQAIMKRFLGPNDEIVDLDYIYRNDPEYSILKSKVLKSENDSTSKSFKEFKLKYRVNPLLVLLPTTIEILEINKKFETVGFGISFPEIINEVTNLYINY